MIESKANKPDKNAVDGADPYKKMIFRLRESDRKKIKKLIAINDDSIQALCEQMILEYIAEHEHIFDKPLRKKRQRKTTKAEVPEFLKRS